MKGLMAFVSAVSVLWLSLAAAAEPKKPTPMAATLMERAALPLSKVVLYSSGVGYFQHDGAVQGQARIDLRFKTDQINDLLKSMVVQDLSGGQVSAITYGSRDPLSKTLSGIGIDLAGHPGLGQLLNQIRGERIEVTAPNAITGTIIGVEKKDQPISAGEIGSRRVAQVEYLNLLTEEGLRSIPLAQVQRFQLLNDRLNQDLQHALSALAASHDSQKKSVSIEFNGEGSRQVRVAYITEAPVWKTAYRLVLDDDRAPFLQGWAIVENTTDLDWKDIRLSLVSGRPISFVMDLYQPLYATRPVVTPELYASLQPRLYGDAMDERAAEEAREDQHGGGPAERATPSQGSSKARRDLTPRSLPPPAGFAAAELKAQMNLQQGVMPTAQGREAGELFEYTINAPVSLSRNTSALLPLIGQDVDGQKVSIYNRAAHVKYPLHGFRLKNTTPLSLMQGPMTVFDGGAYAGDARMDDLAPGQTRLISYALDLNTEIEPKQAPEQHELVSISLRKGVLLATQKIMEETTYQVRNRDRKNKVVLIEHPYRSDWELLEPIHMIERTRDVYRFTVPVEAAQTASLRVREEKYVQQTIQLIDSGSDIIAFYLQSKQISPKVREALQQVVVLRDRLTQTTARRAGQEQRIRGITQEQTRIRENMAKLAQNSDLYNRYVKKLDQQETEIEKLRHEIEILKNTEEEQKHAVNDYLLGLEIT
ncbi:MAG TPA: hypothetical protein VJ692_00905 [Nitrospiraceae bacterium]|nr:hypothetical protein [Nitrospiraceae bacterium]